MTYNDLLRLYFDRSSAVLSLWTLYVVILGGLLAFSSLRKIPDRLTTALISVLFALFAYQNLGGLHDAAVQRLAILETVRLANSPDADALKEKLIPTLNPVSYGNIRSFHVTSDVLALLALWTMELRRRRNAPLPERTE